MASSIWVSITTTDLDRSKAYYSALGFTLNPAFSDTNGACFELGDNQYLMVVERGFFGTMTPKPVGDPKTSVLVGLNINLESREAVDAMIERGVHAGGTEPGPAQDYGFMYTRDLDDPDGNNLGFIFMPPAPDETQAEARAAAESAPSNA